MYDQHANYWYVLIRIWIQDQGPLLINKGVYLIRGTCIILCYTGNQSKRLYTGFYKKKKRERWIEIMGSYLYVYGSYYLILYIEEFMCDSQE